MDGMLKRHFFLFVRHFPLGEGPVMGLLSSAEEHLNQFNGDHLLCLHGIKFVMLLYAS